MTNEKTLHVTNKELFYAAAMLGVQQLVNVLYDFPANEAQFAKELEEVKKSLRLKKLLTESARSGVSMDFALAMCTAFCAEPDSCEAVASDGYDATVYNAAGMHMLLERRSEDDLAALWFQERKNLDQYLEDKLRKEAGSDGGA